MGESTDRLALALQDQNCWRPPSYGGYEVPVADAYACGVLNIKNANACSAHSVEIER